MVAPILEPPHDFKDKLFWILAAVFQFIYSVGGLVLGLACTLGGIVLFLHGVTGSTNWSAKILGANTTVSDAAPGVILFLVGLLIVFITRFVIKPSTASKAFPVTKPPEASK